MPTNKPLSALNPKEVSVKFTTQKGDAIATTYYFDKSGQWYFAIHHTYVDPNTGETKIGKGFAVQTAYAEDMILAVCQAYNQATGSKLIVTTEEE